MNSTIKTGTELSVLVTAFSIGERYRVNCKLFTHKYDARHKYNGGHGYLWLRLFSKEQSSVLAVEA
jgi:hypothetical protein